jgi:hypothetical protein
MHHFTLLCQVQHIQGSYATAPPRPSRMEYPRSRDTFLAHIFISIVPACTLIVAHMGLLGSGPFLRMETRRVSSEPRHSRVVFPNTKWCPHTSRNCVFPNNACMNYVHTSFSLLGEEQVNEAVHQLQVVMLKEKGGLKGQNPLQHNDALLLHITMMCPSSTSQ